MRKEAVMPLVAVLGCLALGGAAARAEAPGDAARGHALAREFCSACHLVDAAQRGPVPDGVTSFMAMAVGTAAEVDQLSTRLLQPPHPQMPAPPMDRQGLRDLVAYIRSLAD